ncbi:MAG TPA: GAF domain-containing protein, partial [Anaerolineaceae bacterium]|nr:GAF domain-containing protein [Anaerolineaceae bacterium]
LAVLIPASINDQLTVILQAYSEDSASVRDETLSVYRVLSTQLGYALDNCQVRSSYESIRNELKTVSAQALKKSWHSQLRFGQQVGFRYSNDELEANVAPSESANRAIAAGTIQLAEHPGESPTTSVAVPILIRDHALGVLDISFEGQGVSSDMLDLIEEISDRLALALENTRLLEENQNRAEQEHALSEITARVRSSSDIDGIMKVAAAEIGRALGVSDVLVQLRSER